jgi:hypothetical protein
VKTNSEVRVFSFVIKTSFSPDREEDPFSVGKSTDFVYPVK